MSTESGISPSSCERATETAAKESAQGIVQDKGWEATFPLLLNLDGEPTYFMALKDKAGVVKSYAMVNVDQFSIVARSPRDDYPDVEACLDAYVEKLSPRVTINIEKDGTRPPDNNDEERLAGVITDIREAVVGGNTVYFIKLADDSRYFALNVSRNRDAAILSRGDTVELIVAKGGEKIVDAWLDTGGAKPEDPPFEEPAPEEPGDTAE